MNALKRKYLSMNDMNSLVCRKVKMTFIIKGNASSFMGVARTAQRENISYKGKRAQDQSLKSYLIQNLEEQAALVKKNRKKQELLKQEKY